jgi:DNA-directed RNA polymerase
VHDSFWTHAGDVDSMNESIRTQFVELYNQPILEDLLSELRMRYPEISFPELPERGQLELEKVKSSKYFFN